jgi:hypothetical protein
VLRADGHEEVRLVSARAYARALVSLSVVLAAASILVVSPGGSAPVAPVASTVIDRTYTCTPTPFLGRRWIAPFAQPGVREFGSRTQWHSLATASLHTGTHYDDSTLMTLTAGYPQPTEGTMGLSLSTQHCRKQAPRIALSARGLRSVAVTPLGERLRCRATKRVTVRIRSVFLDPAILRRGPFGMVAASAPVRRAAIAVRTQDGRPLVFAEIFDQGKARLFTARGCEYF